MLAVAAAALALGIGGCASGRSVGRLETRSAAEPVVLPSVYREAYFRQTPAGASFYLSDRPLEELLAGRPETGQILHVELLWVPKPGVTPISASATNVSVRHVVFAEGEVGVYGGAGFAWVKGKIDTSARVTLAIEDASMALLGATPGFQDLLTPAVLSGRLTAKRDDAMTLRLRQASSQIITDALGASRYVLEPSNRAEPASTGAGRIADAAATVDAPVAVRTTDARPEESDRAS